MDTSLLAFEYAFERPWYLLLLLLIPAIWWLGFQSLAGLGRTRQFTVLILRTLVLCLMVLALAQLQWKKTTDRLTVIFVLDHSKSIPEDKQRLMLDYAHRAVKEFRNRTRKDKAGVIVFGSEARIEVAPYEGELPLVSTRSESAFDMRKDATNLESALKLAKAVFPEATARRIVIVSDGNENLGDAYGLARAMSEDGIGIDVIPVELLAKNEIEVEKVVLPTEIRKDEKFDARVVINYDSIDEGSDNKTTGKILITQKTREGTEKIAEEPVTLTPGKNVFGFSHKVTEADMFQFDATFVPDKDAQGKVKDTTPQNNVASAFTHVRGKGRVLFIEDASETGKFDFLINKLQENNIEVESMPSNELFQSPAELLQFDSIVLADVPRASGDSIDKATGFSDSQIKMLVSNMEDMGCGIVMLGGPHSFGAGGWANTELEKAMPVDFQIKNDRVDAVGALVLIMHASEMSNGNYWQQKIATEAIKVLGPMDYCGVVEWANFGGRCRWLWKKPNGIDRVFKNKKMMMAQVKRMVPGDMPDFEDSMSLALKGLTRPGFNPSMKHVILISDGDASPPKAATIAGYKKAKIKVSTVSVSSHGRVDKVRMQKIANSTGGKFYAVTNPRALPKIFQREARRVAKPLIKEKKGMGLILIDGAQNNEILKGIDLSQLRPIDGYVMTTRKSNSLVEQLIIADEPDDKGENSTVLASWRYGLGKAIVFTTDAGNKWASDWAQSPYYEKFFTQLIRYSMRPVKQNANFTVSTDVKDGEVTIVVRALDKDDKFINHLSMNGRGTDPNMTGFDIQFEQESSGRYVGKFKTDRSGNYLFSIFPGNDYERLTAGITVPYSSEYSVRNSNLSLLESLSDLEPEGGEIGKMNDENFDDENLGAILKIDPFRNTLQTTVGIQDIWPLLLVITGILFFTDVFIRRVAVNFDWVPPAYQKTMAKIRGKDRGEEVSQSMARLQSRKALVESEMESKRASTRFQPEEAEMEQGAQDLHNVLESEDRTYKEKPRATLDGAMIAAEEEEKTQMSRLLEAKRKAQKQRGEDPDKKD